MGNRIETDVAGLQRTGWSSRVSQLVLGEVVSLRREPGNQWDKNAIRVDSQIGQPMGYINRQLAASLAPAFDQAGGTLVGFITAIEGGHFSRRSAVRVAFNISDGVPLLASSSLDEYYYDDSGHYAYVLLNCSQEMFEEIQTKLSVSGLQCPHAGPCFRPAGNQRQYQWFIRVRDDGEVQDNETSPRKPTQERIDNFFDQNFGIYSEQKRIRLLEEDRIQIHNVIQDMQEKLRLAEQELHEYEDLTHDVGNENTLLMEELASRGNKVSMLQAQLEQLQESHNLNRRELDRLRINSSPAPRRFRSDIEDVLRYLLPTVQFVRDSTDVFASELNDYRPALQFLHKLVTAPGTVKAKRVQNAEAWKEVHFSTGQADDGRIYFKQVDSDWCVLISFKKYQQDDIRFLSKQ